MTNLQKQGDKCIAWLVDTAVMGQSKVTALSYIQSSVPGEA
ncbi:hypothetical protein [Polaromonas sp.]|nr:hypothetical protein [Polaromonas sp.]